MAVVLGLGVILVTPYLVYSANGTYNASTLEQNQTMIVTPLNFSNSKYATAVPMDWAPDGRTILIQYGIVDEETSQVRHALALTDSELSRVVELNIPQSFPSGESTDGGSSVFIDQPVSVARFSPEFGSNSAALGRNPNIDIFFLWREDLYFYNVITNDLEKLRDGIVWFDITDSPDVIAYSQYDGGKRTGLVGLFSVSDKSSKNILENVPHLYTFDLSPDGTRIVYKDDGDSRSSQVNLVYYDLDSGERNIIGPALGCSYIPHWTYGGSNHIIIKEGGCNRGYTGTAISVVSLEDQTVQRVVPDSYDQIGGIVYSPNGESMFMKVHGSQNGTISSSGSGHMYRVDYAQPIPEFGFTTLTAVGVITVSTVLMVSTRYILRRK